MAIVGSVRPANALGMRLPVSGGTPTPSVTLPAGYSLWWDADTVTPQGDNTNFTGNWTDKVAGVSITQATGSLQPRYRTNVFGKAGFSVGGARCFPINRPSQLVAALASSGTTTGSTIIFVQRPSAVDNSFPCFWSPSNVNDSHSLLQGNTQFGPRGATKSTPAQSGVLQVVIACGSTITSNQVGQQACTLNQNGNSFMTANITDAGGNYIWGATGDGNGDWGFDGEIMQLIVYPRELTRAEQITAITFWHNYYSRPLPWAAATKIFLADGDSYTAGYNTWFEKLLVIKGAPYGSYINSAVGSRTSDNMLASVDRNFAGLAAAYGKPLVLFGFEFYNQPNADSAGIRAYWDAVAATAPEIYRAGITSTDNGQLPGQSQRDNRPGFNSTFMASANVALKIPIHLDATMGVEGACPNDPGPYGPNFQDIIGHPTDAGQIAIRTYMSSYYDTALAA